MTEVARLWRRRCCKDCVFCFCLRLFSPGPHRWQNLQSAPSEHPTGRRKKPQGLHLPTPCCSEPRDGTPVSVASGWPAGCDASSESPSASSLSALQSRRPEKPSPASTNLRTNSSRKPWLHDGGMGSGPSPSPLPQLPASQFRSGEVSRWSETDVLASPVDSWSGKPIVAVFGSKLGCIQAENMTSAKGALISGVGCSQANG